MFSSFFLVLDAHSISIFTANDYILQTRVAKYLAFFRNLIAEAMKTDSFVFQTDIMVGMILLFHLCIFHFQDVGDHGSHKLPVLGVLNQYRLFFISLELCSIR